MNICQFAVDIFIPYPNVIPSHFFCKPHHPSPHTDTNTNMLYIIISFLNVPCVVNSSEAELELLIMGSLNHGHIGLMFPTGLRSWLAVFMGMAVLCSLSGPGKRVVSRLLLLFSIALLVDLEGINPEGGIIASRVSTI